MSFTVYNILEYAGLRILDVVVFFLTNAILITGFAFSNYPNASTFVVSVLTLYIIYKMIGRIVRLWLNILISMIKFFFLVVFLFVLAAVYVRGFNRFFTKDIYFLKEFFTAQAEASDQNFKHYAYKFMEDDKFDFLGNMKDFFEGSSFQVDENYEYGETYDNLKNAIHGALGDDSIRQLNNLFNRQN